MALVTCAHCGRTREYEWSIRLRLSDEKDDVLRAVLTCRRCGKPTVFGMTNEGITFAPGKELFSELSQKSPEDARLLFTDATLAFYISAYRAAVSVGRASLEQALIGKGAKEDKLEIMIDDALAQKIISPTQHMLAHGSRLVGNAALHKAKAITPTEAQVALGAVSQIANALFP